MMNSTRDQPSNARIRRVQKIELSPTGSRPNEPGKYQSYQRSTTLTMEKWSAQSIIAVKHAAEITILVNHVVYSEILWRITPVLSGNSHK